MSKPNLKLLQLLMLVPMSATVFASVTTGTDEQAQLPFWEWKSANMQLRLVQRLPDQTRAFFAGRGFSPSDVEQIAQSCVFQSIYKNICLFISKLLL